MRLFIRTAGLQPTFLGRANLMMPTSNDSPTSPPHPGPGPGGSLACAPAVPPFRCLKSRMLTRFLNVIRSAFAKTTTR